MLVMDQLALIETHGNVYKYSSGGYDLTWKLSNTVPPSEVGEALYRCT